MKRNRHILHLVGFIAIFAGGCTGTDQSVFGTFIFDFARNAVAAFLL